MTMYAKFLLRSAKFEYSKPKYSILRKADQNLKHLIFAYEYKCIFFSNYKISPDLKSDVFKLLRPAAVNIYCLGEVKWGLKVPPNSTTKRRTVVKSVRLVAQPGGPVVTPTAKIN